MGNVKPKIVMRISEALEKLDPITSAELIEELKTHPPNYWMVTFQKMTEYHISLSWKIQKKTIGLYYNIHQ